jgi:hypothetical protein
MKTRLHTAAALCVLVCFTQVACYNKYTISPAQLAKLEASAEQKNSVAVVVDNCDVGKTTRLMGESVEVVAEGEGATDGGAAAAKEAPAQENIDPQTGCPTVSVNTASPIRVLDKEGNKYRVTPFNFAVTDTQVVAPDYGLLLPIGEVEGAEIQTFSGLKTGLMIGGGALLAVGGFVLLALTAPEERGFGTQE